ncbi:hypothetical protein QPL79_03310 [Ignisphaera sp. 4213-co]|uniref:Thioredoxin n=1 Tax=Ignisphaera cupida TaxID=3050454 RepID=A0ABD4Z7V4_9CREN|nr:hypothetical protein [Ignisphaera sp. 4213-co]MDK6028390.1 hypothetical protein [Ignisphaera sp. 4213-co]
MSKDLFFKRLDSSSPHGIYFYDDRIGMWKLLRSDGGAFEPFEKGVYVIYFDNAKCSACRRYDEIWYPFVDKWIKEKDKGFKFVIVFCDWFARECRSSAAAETFKKFDVHASPTTIVLYVDNNNTVKYQEKYEGVMYEFELKLILEKFEERALKAMKGEKVSPPISKESGKSLEDLIMQILKALTLGEKKD